MPTTVNNTFIPAWRLAMVALVISGCFAGVLARLYHLHVLEQPELARIVQENRRGLEIRHARRGSIFDRRGNLLATTRPVITVGVDPQETDPEQADKRPELARLLGIPLAHVRACFEGRIRRGSGRYHREVQLVRWRKLADGVGDEVYEKVMALGIQGVYGNRKYERHYPGKGLAAHLVGFVNKEGVPATGVEAFMDYYLRGHDGWREVERDGSTARRELVHFRNREVPPAHGLSAELTVDAVVQSFLEEELRRLVEEYRPKSATIIVSEPATGYILGLANAPSFDLNAFWEVPVGHLRNIAVTDTFEPGSTFKIVPGTAALHERVVTRDTLIDCSLSALAHGGRIRSLPRDHKPYGVLTFENTIIKSSNRAAAQVGMLLGARRLHRYAAAYGFGERTGLGFGGEVRGTLHPVRRWDGKTITRLPMGHAVAATPLQVHYAMATVANRGILMTPVVVRRVVDEDGVEVVPFNPRARRRVVGPRAARLMSDMLMKTVRKGGTAPRAEIPGYEVAGKTGTSQKIINGRYSHSHHVASFSGFFPASSPRLVVTVVVDDAQLPGTAYGGIVAAPAFRNVAEKLIRYLEIEPPKTALDDVRLTADGLLLPGRR